MDVAPPSTSAPSVRTQAVLALVLVALCLAPFLGRALDFDDPLFVWSAQRIAQAPLDPYGIQVNWYGSLEPFSEVTKNPPLQAYLLAPLGMLSGWSELALGLVPLAAALAATLGTFVLARRLGADPLFAALACALTPAFLVAGTTVMADATLLALWVWSLIAWERGLRERELGWLVLAAVLAAAAAWTKYFGLALVPLCALWAWGARAPLARWLPALAVTLLLVGAWEGVSAWQYGHGLVLEAFGYAARARDEASRPLAGVLVSALAFLGGSAASLAFLAPWLARLRVLLALLALGATVALGVALWPERAQLVLASPALPDLGQALQLGLWTAVGAGALALALAELRERRGVESLVLTAWVLGTFAFAGVGNWTVNARALLPAVPALAVLAGRRFARRERALGERLRGPRSGAWPALGFALAALLALAVARSAARDAAGARRAAHELGQRYGTPAGARAARPTCWFQGHWGLQYYAEREGLRALDYARDTLDAGELVVLPLANTNVLGVPAQACELVETLAVDGSAWIAVHRGSANAGFHSSGWGFLPFALARVEPLRFRVWRARERFEYR